MTQPSSGQSHHTPQSPRRVAVVFIHGIGVQDRYQQLASFTDGLRFTSKAREFWVDERGKTNQPRGRVVPLSIKNNAKIPGCGAETEVDVSEVYWAPLLNGLTTWRGVLQWILITLAQGIRFRMPGNKKKAVPESASDKRTELENESPPPASQTSGLKWSFETAYVLIVGFIASNGYLF